MTLDPKTAIQSFHFRDLHPLLYLGTCSDRYSGWIGQIYTEEKYRGRIISRTNKMGKLSFKEEVLPVNSVREYFEHFRVLEVDYTFYSLLLDEKGQPTKIYRVMERYREHLGKYDYIVAKVPQVICAQKLRLKQGAFRDNPDYLNAEIFARRFYEPIADILGEQLLGLLFEQEYQRAEERTAPGSMASELDTFFSAVPKDDRYQIELRTESYLSEPVLRILEKHGVGQVLSHWTWLPPLFKQFALCGRRFFNSRNTLIIRLSTPIGVRYEKAYIKAHPFDRMVEGMLQKPMVKETARIAREAVEQGIGVVIVTNNRAGGNAPMIAQMVAEDFLVQIR